MSKSAILSSSIAKKWWMSLTGLFLCLFLVGHLLGNLQIIFFSGDEGQRVFNEYAYFMTHNPLIKLLSYLTYFSILFHAVDGIILTFQNKRARPIKYAYSKPQKNSSTPSRYMAILGSAILIFIIMHMSNFWGVMHFDKNMPLHTKNLVRPDSSYQKLYLTTNGTFLPVEQVEINNKTELIDKELNLKIGEGYKDLHSLTVSFFGHNKTNKGFPPNKYAYLAVILYVFSMAVLSFHLWHGFNSAFQTLGISHEKYNSALSLFGKIFSVLVPLAFASIPITIFLTK
ncbi:MAG: succinate dehydrogenase [Crocinitomicaceae bacterium]|nr:succinate dehydrogenase [Crocinitomicaceae bacterium]|tara:strand:- start:75834 stop:76688 length:855 start_codon:yes stop_codon:yes gene_type:complete